MCKERTSVSHSSTESEVISLDAGLRMGGLFVPDLWDIVIEVLRTTEDNTQPITLALGNWRQINTIIQAPRNWQQFNPTGQRAIPKPRPNMRQENKD